MTWPRTRRGASLVLAVLVLAASVNGVAGDQRGVASWYPADGLVAAVPSWRWGDTPWRARVCRLDDRERCVTVVVSDCLCGRSDRLIDLSDDAFRRLAPLSAGLVRVSLSRVAGGDGPSDRSGVPGPLPVAPLTLPETDTAP